MFRVAGMVQKIGLSKSTHICMWFHRNRICTGTHHMIRFMSFSGGHGKAMFGVSSFRGP